MPNRYNQATLTATIQLINAVNHGVYTDAQQAIQQGADVNCRVIKTEDGYSALYIAVVTTLAMA